VLDAGSGIRNLGLRLAGRARRIDILLTHVHLDHIQGLTFFAPLFIPDAEIVIWGPPDAETLRERLACYVSPPLTPLNLHELPARISFRAARRASGRSGPCASKQLPSPTPAPPSATGSARETRLSATSRPRTRPRPTAQRARTAVAPRLRPGTRRLAPRPRLPVHGRRVPESHRLGALPPQRGARLRSAHRGTAARLFHHDPLHDDEQLDGLHGEAVGRSGAAGRSLHEVLMAAELQELELDRAGTGVAAAASPTAASCQ
jgi:Beta-lactamase superfamily domain